MDYRAETPCGSGSVAVVYGTDPDLTVRQGGDVEVGAIYPVRLRTLAGPGRLRLKQCSTWARRNTP